MFSTFGYVLALILVHLLSGKFRILSMAPRSRWLSFAGGIAVAYIFVHVIPELHEMQKVLSSSTDHWTSFADMHIYLISMLGLLIFYGIERLAKLDKKKTKTPDHQGRIGAKTFWVHVASFCIYNSLIGYLLIHRGEKGSTLLFFIAMAVHFLTNDYGLWFDYKQRYEEIGRWIFSAGLVVGWGIGILIKLPESVIALVFALLSGGVILNVLKEELPEERESSFWSFMIGALLYAGILIAI